MSVYEEVKLAEMRFDSDQLMYFYTCPCGDLFEISLEELHDGEDIALCPSCSLKLRVLFEESDLLPLPSEDSIEASSLALKRDDAARDEQLPASKATLQALACDEDE
mmetsp:Transcript_26309/g.53908  ORF Transcript_26309/g.53908 Transcript_26309/m.53908 type:complete len:107 (+) Transcript_26309:124-444(+)|eukprot:CAMPEP_0171824020 /NCGR_PEP_ID=MMETSP0992-20121227/4748_1 /TAXON_ID=483369 /ORGANISM="non described non described, Strain CCMP2098" /LENGTH=106 /DNA_ID=CAMNT_0012438791 /DNA_START=124 /DNA_END=444 /DNA_ORIENTATION=-